jgi:hypothetical protein
MLCLLEELYSTKQKEEEKKNENKQTKTTSQKLKYINFTS